jgi:hypothetical protein
MSTAVMLVIVIEIYYAATTLFDLSPFNGAKYFAPKERLTEWITNSLVFALPLLPFLIPSAWPAGVIAYGFLLVGEYASWWHGYLTQKPVRRDFYDKATRYTTLVLSQDQERFQPNLEHIILHGLTLITFIALLADVLR